MNYYLINGGLNKEETSDFFRILYNLPNLISDIHDSRELRNKKLFKKIRVEYSLRIIIIRSRGF